MMTVEQKPSTLAQEYVTLKLSVGPQEEIFGSYELCLFIRKDWWTRSNIPPEPEKNKPLFVSINEDDLRIRHLPQMSTLTLFNNELTIDHDADGLEIQVNASIEIVEFEKGKEFEGIIKSGSIVFKNFHQTFLNDEWLSKLTNQDAELLLGRSKIQLKSRETIENQEQKKTLLYDFIGEIPGPEYIWKLVPCIYDNVYSPLELLSSYEDAIIKHAKSIPDQSIRIEKLSPSELAERFSEHGVGVYRRTSEKKESETYLKPGLKVHVFQETSAPIAPALTWIPQSLKVKEKEGSINGETYQSYTLLDYDEIDLLLTTGKLLNLDENFGVKIKWQGNDKRSIQLQDQEEEYNRLFLSHVTDSDVIHKNYLWQMARMDKPDVECTWTRYRLEPFPISSEINENSTRLSTQTKNLSGSILKFYNFSNEDQNPNHSWKLLINIPEKKTSSPTDHPQLQLNLNKDEVLLELHRPNVLAVTPEMAFYPNTLLDPSSMPADKLWSPHLKNASLVFQNTLSKANASLASQSIQFNLLPGEEHQHILKANPKQVVFFKPSMVAGIDRVSPSRNNLTAIPLDSAPSPSNIQRDPNHGLIPWEIKKFSLEFLDDQAFIRTEEKNILEKYCTEALMPWVERKFTDPSKNDEMKLYHRNLVLEHSEFEITEAYQEIEGGQTTYNASDSFIRAVRDRYCLAADLNHAKPTLLNWLPGATFLSGTDAITPLLTYHSEEETEQFPKVDIDWELESCKVLKTQSLGIDANENWLDYALEPALISEQIQIKLSDPSSSMRSNAYRTVNSHTPLLFGTKHYYDNLGVIRETGSTWFADIIYSPNIPEKKCYRLSIANFRLINPETTSDTSEELSGLTEMIFSCDELKISPDGTILKHEEAKRFHESPMNLGVYGFFSYITAEKNTPLTGVDYWPRYKGVPFLVIEVQKLKLKEEDEEIVPEFLEWSAVIANPQQIDEGSDPEAIPNFILHAVKNKKLVRFRYTFASETIELLEGSSIDWQFFSSQPQFSHPLTATLTRVTGNIYQNLEKIQIEALPEQTSIHALGKSWRLENIQLALESETLFSKGPDDNYIQTKYDFRSTPDLKSRSIGHGIATKDPEDPNGLLITAYTPQSNAIHDFYGSYCRISSDGEESNLLIQSYEIVSQQLIKLTFDSSWNTLPPGLEECKFEIFESNYLLLSSTSDIRQRYHLPFRMALQQPLPRTGEDIEALISNDSRLILYLARDLYRSKLLTPSLMQGDLQCFLIQSLKSQKKIFGEECLLLWLENDQLGALIVRNLFLTDFYQSFYFSGDNDNSCKKTFQAGLDVEYLTPENKWYRYTTLSLTLEKDNCTLRFDDQNFSDLNEIAIEDSVLKTAYFQIVTPNSPPDLDHKNQIQGPIVVQLKKNANDKILIDFGKSWFWMTKIRPAKETLKNPDILSIFGTFQESHFVRQALLDVHGQHFVTFEYDKDKHQFNFFEIDKDLMPINFCLDPDAIDNTIKLKKTIPQLLHRQMFGKMLRIDLSKNLYKPSHAEGQKKDLDITIKKGEWLLRPIARNLDQQLVVMSDNVFLEKSTVAPKPVQTETVLIINRPIYTDPTHPPYVAISNRTITYDAGTEAPKENHEHEIQKRILEMGASGVIIRRILDNKGLVNYQFVSSPFYSNEAIRQISKIHSDSSFSNALQAGPNEKNTHLDFRSQMPTVIKRIQNIRYQNSYKTVPSSNRDPCICKETIDGDRNSKKMCCCSFKREVIYEYQGSMSEDYLHEEKQPSFYLYDTPAFKNMNPLWHIPAKKQLSTMKLMEEKASAGNIQAGYFLPHKIYMRYGSDKPGAMFHHEARNIVHDSSLPGDYCEVGNSVEFAMREPQEIKKDGCVSASIEAVQYQESSPESNGNFSNKRITVEWEDVFGKIPLSDLNLNFTFKLPSEGIEKLEYIGDFSKGFPFKVIVHHNYDVFTLQSSDASIPAYGNEASTDISWAPYFLASKTDSFEHEIELPELIEPEELSEVTAQNSTATVHPYLMITEMEFISHGERSLELKSEEDAEYLRSFGENIKVFISGLIAEMEEGNTAPWEIDNISGKVVHLKHVTKLQGTPSQKMAIVCNLDSVLSNKTTSGNYFLWSFNIPNSYLHPASTQFQILWLASIQLKETQGNHTLQQMASCRFYQVEKQVKLLMPAITAPKIAGVLHLFNKEPQVTNAVSTLMKKTIFFGNSVPPERGQSQLESYKEDGTTHYRVKIFAPDQEEVEVSFPKAVFSKSSSIIKNLYLLKYLNKGQIVYGTWKNK